jgi:hypothetical protein
MKREGGKKGTSQLLGIEEARVGVAGSSILPTSIQLCITFF